jgi:hypothetical protein
MFERVRPEGAHSLKPFNLINNLMAQVQEFLKWKMALFNYSIYIY